MSTVVIVHGWGADSESDWLPWLKEELEKRGITAITPDMPNTNAPEIEEWITFLNNTVKEIDENVYFVGHSVGCQAILRYLQTLPTDKKVGGAVFVAGFVTALIRSEEEKEEVIKPWLETPIDWDKVLIHTKNFVAIYSDDDPYVPVSNAEVLKEKLNAKLVLDSGRGHFTESFDITQLPSVLDELLVIMGLPVETTLI
jgi:predicted alpha/beta hydrolase family esterase